MIEPSSSEDEDEDIVSKAWANRLKESKLWRAKDNKQSWQRTTNFEIDYTTKNN